MGRYVKINGELVPIAGIGGGGQDTNFKGKSMADWNALTQEEQNQYDTVDLTDDYTDLTDDIDAIGTVLSNTVEAVNAINQKMTDDILWENASPTAAFEAQTVPLDLSGYQKVCICFAHSSELLLHIGYGGKAITYTLYNSRFITDYRIATVSDSGITFSDNIRIQQTSSGSAFSQTTMNNVNMPLKIIGLH